MNFFSSVSRTLLTAVTYVPRQVAELWRRHVANFWADRIAPLWMWRQPKVFRAIRVEDFPERLRPRTVYLAGENEHLWAAALVCPCGCGDVIELNLLKQARPRWSAGELTDGTVTLTPSVWRQKGCRSHFILCRGRVEWC